MTADRRRRTGRGAEVERIAGHELGQLARQRRHVQRQLPQRHGLRVRSPVQVRFRHTFQDAPRRRGLRRELFDDRDRQFA